MRQIASLRSPWSFVAPNASLAAFPESQAWALVAAILVAAAALMHARGPAFDWASANRPLIASVGLSIGALIYRRWRPDERIAATLVAVAQLVAFSAAAAVLSYAVASLDRPLWDATLMAWDQALGLDWRVYLAAADAHPHLAQILNLAYASLMAQMIGAAGVLGLSGRFAACRRFVLAMMLAAIVTILISGAMPAVSMVTRLGLRAADHPNLDFSAVPAALAPFNALRDGTLRIVSLAHAEGIITFPSFHAALGVIFARAFWSVRWARWPALALNALLIAATPLDGGHFFVDVIAGIAIALGAIVGADALDRSAAEERISSGTTRVSAPGDVSEQV